MTIYEWADRLGMDPHKGRNPEDFWTVCPCHADTKPSLHVYIGKKTGEIVMKCFVCGATGGEVCKALGLPIGEVMCDAMSGEKKLDGRRQAKPKAAPTAKKPKRSALFEIDAPLRVGGSEYTIKDVYEYRTADGRVVLRKARAELWDGETRIGKSFLIQSIGTDGKWYSGGGIYTNLIYHQPDVLAMKGKPGRTIIAEGEKDVDNLRRIGLNATCGMHGGGIDRGGDSLLGKWNDDHSKCFDGLDEVVVIADNDAAGEGISQWICRRLKDRVKSLKLLRIVEHWPQLAAHGDFTDWANELIRAGKKRSEIRVALESMIEETPVWEPGNIRHFEKEGDAQEDIKVSKGKTVRADGFDGGGGSDEKYPSYHGSATYCIKNGRLALRVGQQGAQVLCDFLPEPKEIIRRDDGVIVTTEYLIGAKAPDGTELPDAHVVGNAEFKRMDWAMDTWDHQGNIKPVKNAEKRIVDAINTAGQKISRKKSIYAHTGVREIDGKPAYLFGGGAIGAENVSVELEGTLSRYHLRDEGHSRMDAAIAELVLIDGMPDHVIYPMLAQAYLAPVFSAMESLQQPPAYVVYVVGASNAGKSTVAGYVQAHFGDFYNRRFPANFNDTANNIRDKLFLAKDALLVIDDYRKGDDTKKYSAMDMVADNAISAVADRADRGRQTTDKKSAPVRPSRCTCIMTGEDTPRVSTSRLMRLYRIDVEPGEIYTDARELDVYRQTARQGLYRACMRFYVEDLLARWDGIEDELCDRIDDAQSMMSGMIRRKEGRYIESATHLMVGIGLMLDHLIACGVMDGQEKTRRMELAAKHIAANVDEQGRSVDEEKPERIWLQTLRSLLATNSVTLGNKDDISTGFRAGDIGFRDGALICLVPSACDEHIGERLRKGGRSLNATRPAILKALARAGMIRCKYREDGGIGDVTFNTHRGQTQMRMIHLYAWALLRDTPPTPGEQSFTPIDGEQLPMEFKDK